MLSQLTSSINAVKPGRTNMPVIDVTLLFVITALVLFGLLMVYSASIALPDNPNYAGYSRYHFVGRHAVFILVGLIMALTASAISMKYWQKFAVPMAILCLILLCLVLVNGIGKTVNGASRWIPIGIINIQPSELAKLGIILYASDYVVRKQKHMKTFLRGFLPMMMSLGLVALLLLAEPDLGATIVIVGIALGILFIGGLNGWQFTGLIGIAASGFLALIWTSPWRRDRIFAYLDPWSAEHAYGTGYQLSHSLIAFGRGEWFGVGLGASIEKLHYLPEAHTDFIMAVIGEELGFIGVIILLLLFVFIVMRGFEIARQAVAMERKFSGLVAQGIVLWLGVQTFINVGVALGLLPTKGLTLPMVSYGGTSIVMNLIACAILLRVDYENRLIMKGERV